MSKTIIYHNPRCSKSRQTLQLLEENNIPVEIVEYLKNPPSKARLTKILKSLNLSPRELMRSNEAEYKELNLKNSDLNNNDLLQAMLDHPKLIQRPIVLHGDNAAIGRPPEAVLELF